MSDIIYQALMVILPLIAAIIVKKYPGIIPFIKQGGKLIDELITVISLTSDDNKVIADKAREHGLNDAENLISKILCDKL